MSKVIIELGCRCKGPNPGTRTRVEDAGALDGVAENAPPLSKRFLPARELFFGSLPETEPGLRPSEANGAMATRANWGIRNGPVAALPAAVEKKLRSSRAVWLHCWKITGTGRLDVRLKPSGELVAPGGIFRRDGKGLPINQDYFNNVSAFVQVFIGPGIGPLDPVIRREFR